MKNTTKFFIEYMLDLLDGNDAYWLMGEGFSEEDARHIIKLRDELNQYTDEYGEIGTNSDLL